MSATIWMPLYIGDYLKDTARLSTQEHGAYLLLIMDYWVSGRLNDDDDQLAAVTKMRVELWRKMKPKIMGFFLLKEGQYLHPRIEEELFKSRKNIQDAKVRAAKGGAANKARWAARNKEKKNNATR